MEKNKKNGSWADEFWDTFNNYSTIILLIIQKPVCEKLVK